MNETLVIAEDEDDIRNNLSRLLRLEGFNVLAAPNGLLAMDLIRKHQPAVVLSDVMMPEMTGHQLSQSLRADPELAHVPVILLTARADRQDVREGMNLGADDYLTKPFQREELLSSIRSRLDKLAVQQHVAQRLAAQSHHQAHHDSVTDLPNRTHFLILLNALLQSNQRREQTPVMWAFGLDNLAEMAQVLSSRAMDDCVCQLVQRIQAKLQSEAFAGWGRAVLARPSDDRLVLVFEHMPEGVVGQEVTLLMLETLSQPMAVGDEQHFPRISVGLLTLDQTELTADKMLGHLDITLAQARQQPAHRVSIQSLQSSRELGATFKLHNDLHLCVERQELRALFQPQIDAKTHQLLGFESLMRWDHQQLGLISPARFIPLAEDNGQIVPMGRWMLQTACSQAAQWNTSNAFSATPIRMAVNLSLRQFCDPAIARHIEEALELSGLAPELLELEITEGTAMLDLQRTLKLLNQFKRMGLQLAIDDFGTGYSSLAYLKRFPLDVLKIDQSFVRSLCTDEEDKAISRAVITLAHSLDMRVIAEGVEQTEQHRLLTEMGCDEIQGFLHGKPMEAAAVPQWQTQHRLRWDH